MNKSHIRSHLCQLPKYIQDNSYTYLVKTLKSNGAVWLVDRLKNVQSYFLNRIANPESVIPMPFFKKNEQHELRGFFSIHEKLYKQRRYLELLNLLNIYRFISTKSVIQKQINKVLEALSCPKKASEQTLAWLYDLPDDLEEMHFALPRGVTVSKKIEDMLMPSKFNPTVDMKSKKYDLQSQLKWLSTSQVNNYLGYGQPSLESWRIQIGHMIRNSTDVPYEMYNPKPQKYVGKISFIQEGGLKLRHIANPPLIWQVLLEDLKNSLFEALRNIPDDYTFDQDAGRRRVAEALKSGKRCFSVDLKSATDTFPLEFSLKIVQDCFDYSQQMAYEYRMKHKNGESPSRPNSYLKNQDPSKFRHNPRILLLKELSRGIWKSPIGDLQWTKGQPLGLGPSFALFAFSHHALVRRLWYWIKGESNPTVTRKSVDDPTYRSVKSLYDDYTAFKLESLPYCILGDDLVIFDEQLYHTYVRTIEELGCDISLDKTFSSRLFAEFAGSKIVDDEVFNIGKFKPIDNDNFVDYIKRVGIKGIGHLQGNKQKVMQIHASLPEPVGLGLNPEGLSISQRIDDFIELYFQTVKVDLDDDSHLIKQIEYLSWSDPGFVGIYTPPKQRKDYVVRKLLATAIEYGVFDEANEFSLMNYFSKNPYSHIRQVDPLLYPVMFECISQFVYRSSPKKIKGFEERMEELGISSKPSRKSVLTTLYQRYFGK